MGASFQLSFAAVLALMVVFEAWQRRAPDQERAEPGPFWAVWRYLAGVSATTLVAGAATTPFAAFHFQTIPTYGVLANLVAVPLTSFLVMPAGMVGPAPDAARARGAVLPRHDLGLRGRACGSPAPSADLPGASVLVRQWPGSGPGPARGRRPVAGPVAATVALGGAGAAGRGSCAGRCWRARRTCWSIAAMGMAAVRGGDGQVTVARVAPRPARARFLAAASRRGVGREGTGAGHGPAPRHRLRRARAASPISAGPGCHWPAGLRPRSRIAASRRADRRPRRPRALPRAASSSARGRCGRPVGSRSRGTASGWRSGAWQTAAATGHGAV